ncbi:MAG TPA: tRNA (adenosine(37)-N6)-threonylcarbamoyltransferase complex dimerization subunit type 1 TsaB [Clostridiales bacterium]|nr:tRNA (adenosine(37)-N6)-threonylcarbamoyltransferase complex dimerization subunit type 1 TsaB [Clostridiales bacterium]
MLLLAMDASTACLSLALTSDDGLRLEVAQKGPATRAESVLPAVYRLFRDAQLSPSELQAVVVGVGPGSFTGTRVAVAAAKGLAYGRNLPLVAVSTLDTMAAGLPAPGLRVCPLLDARREEVYGAVYQNPCAGRPLAGYVNLPLVEFLSLLDDGPAAFLGDGALRYRERIAEHLGDRAWFAPEEHAHPRGLVLARLGRERLRAGETTDPHTLVPLYLRRSEAEQAWPKSPRS